MEREKFGKVKKELMGRQVERKWREGEGKWREGEGKWNGKGTIRERGREGERLLSIISICKLRNATKPFCDLKLVRVAFPPRAAIEKGNEEVSNTVHLYIEQARTQDFSQGGKFLPPPAVFCPPGIFLFKKSINTIKIDQKDYILGFYFSDR